jgi:hypothetical protein
MENSASSSDTTVVPSVCSNERLPGESEVSVDHSTATQLSPTLTTRTSKFLIYGSAEERVMERSSDAPASFQPDKQANTSSKSAIWLSVMISDGMANGYKHADYCQAHKMPTKLRAIANQIEAMLQTNK